MTAFLIIYLLTTRESAILYSPQRIVTTNHLKKSYTIVCCNFMNNTNTIPVICNDHRHNLILGRSQTTQI